MGKRGPRAKVELALGLKINMLTVTGEPASGKVPVRCECGNEKTVAAADLRRGHTRSCGCLPRRVGAESVPVLKECQWDGICRCCDSDEIKSRGLCATCYNRAYTRGVLDEVALPSRGLITAVGSASPFWKGDTVDYNGAHKRMARLRGQAGMKGCAEGCGNQASHWSYDGYCPEERLCPERNAPYCYHYERHYQPRCNSCHRDWDRDQVVVADSA